METSGTPPAQTRARRSFRLRFVRLYAHANRALRAAPRFLVVDHPLLGLGAALVSLWVAWHLVSAVYRAETPEQRGDALRTVAQIVGAAILLAGLYWTARNSHISREGQITERFTRAVEQLGDDKLELRLGGIYALERIARDSARDQPAVMDVLTAFVRERSPWPPPDPDDRYITTSGAGDTRVTTPRTRADIQAALTVIGRREQGKDREPHPLDLSDADLRRYDLSGANLSKVTLVGSRLVATSLWDANLSGANLLDADLTGAIVPLARFRGAFLYGANFTDAQGLLAEQIAEAEWTSTTILPPEVRDALGDPPPAFWERPPVDSPR